MAKRKKNRSERRRKEGEKRKRKEKASINSEQITRSGVASPLVALLSPETRGFSFRGPP